MERRRCTSCRNPIRTRPVAMGPAEHASWFHRDCFHATRERQQREYRSAIAQQGLAAALAPYSAGPLRPAVLPVLEPAVASA